MAKEPKYRVEFKARTEGQQELIESLHHNDITLVSGPAGTGKTFIAAMKAIELFDRGEVDKILLARPAVTAGENLGFLPGDMGEKLDPFLRPIYDALNERWMDDQIKDMVERDEIEITSIGHLRGRSFKNTFMFLDECQNLTYEQTKMSLTRFGKGCKMIMTGDPDQVDLKPVSSSGFVPWMNILEHTRGIGKVILTEKDVQRHPIVARILHDEKCHINKTEQESL